MLISLDYPVNARATLPLLDGHVKVNGFGLLTSAFEIPDAKQGMLPVVVEFQSGRTGAPRVKYRQDQSSGQYFRSGGTVNNAVKNGAMTPSWDGEPCFSALERLRHREHDKLRAEGAVVWPERTANLQQRDTFDQLSQVNQSDVGRCRLEAQEFLSHCLVADKMIWVPCSEPLLKVKRGNEYWVIELDNHRHYAHDWHTYLFSIDEFDEAVQWLDVLNDELGERPKRDAVMVVHNAAVHRNGAVEDALELARNVMSKVATAAANLADQTSEVIGIYAKLKTVIEADAGELEARDIDEALSSILRLCDIDEEGGIEMKELDYEQRREQLYRRDYPLHRLRGAVDLHHRRWQDRSISFQIANRGALHP
jgi:hypothetical protein